MTEQETTDLVAILSKPGWDTRAKALHYVQNAPRSVETPEPSTKRTSRQNRALHAFYGLVADELNNGGLDIRAVIKPSIEIPWNAEMVKEYLWRPIQKLALGKESTTQLDTGEIDKVYEIFNQHIAKFGVHVPFPSMENKVDYPWEYNEPVF
jgi:hypothetical protein